MPLGELEDEAMGRILLVGADQTVRSSLNEMMGSDDFKIESAVSGFEAGIQAESLHPDCVVIDFAMGRNEALMIAQNLRKNSEYTETVLIGLLNDDDNASGFDRTLFSETFRKPFDAALLAERIRTLVGRKKQCSPGAAPLPAEFARGSAVGYQGRSRSRTPRRPPAHRQVKRHPD